jgi:hypothetical protein
LFNNGYDIPTPKYDKYTITYANAVDFVTAK